MSRIGKLFPAYHKHRLVHVTENLETRLTLFENTLKFPTTNLLAELVSAYFALPKAHICFKCAHRTSIFFLFLTSLPYVFFDKSCGLGTGLYESSCTILPNISYRF